MSDQVLNRMDIVWQYSKNVSNLAKQMDVVAFRNQEM